MLLRMFSVMPTRAHRQGVFADRHTDAQGRAQLHADRVHGVIQRSVFTRFTAGCHPIATELDALERDGRGQQVGDGFGHRHAARRGRIQGGQRSAFTQAHGFTAKARVVGQRYGAIGHRHLPRPDHLVTVTQAAHRAVTDRDEKPFAGNRGVAQHIQRHLRQRHVGQIKR